MAKIHRSILVLCLLVTCMAIFTGCIDKQKLKVMFSAQDENASASALVSPDGDTGSGAGSAEAQATQSLNINGSVSALPLMKLLGDAFSASNGCIVNVTAGGKDDAIAAVDSGDADAAIYEDSATPVENAQVIASYGIMLIVKADFSADNIEYDHVVELFTDQDNMIGDAEVQLVLTGPDSHTRQAFEEIFPIKGEVEGVQKSLVPDTASIVERDSDVVSEVLANPSAIGVVSIGTDLQGAKALLINGLSPQDEGYSAREQIVLYMGQSPSELSKAFADFIRSDAAKKVLSDNGYTLR